MKAMTKAEGVEEVATDPEQAPAYMMQALLGFNEQLERLGEVAVVLLVGGLLSFHFLPSSAFWFIPLLFLVLRPLAVWAGLLGPQASRAQAALTAWFGIRGIGSLYYLMYALRYDLPPAFAQLLTALTVTTIAVFIVVHGVSATPLMKLHGQRTQAAEAEGKA
jgi:sodium/hydrogen antiporter